MTATRAQRILALVGAGGRAESLAEALRGQCEVVIVATVEEAVQALAAGAFDAVISDVAGFWPLERALAAGQSGLILDTIGEGICVVDGAGQTVWANRRVKQWSAAAREKIAVTCREAYGVFTRQVGPVADEAGGPTGGLRAKKYAINVDEVQHLEMICSPVLDAARRVAQVVAICWDATSGRRLQQKIDAIDQAGRELVRLEGEALAKLEVGQRLKLLEEKIIKYCRGLMHFDNFAIRVLDRRTGKLEPVIGVGMPMEIMEMELLAETDGNGISGYVAATGRSYICPDVQKDPRYLPGLTAARSSLTVPLMLHDKTIGVFNIESQQIGAFTEDDRQFAEIFGRYVAVALNILDLLIVERTTASGQLVQNVTGEISAPLSDILSDAALLMEEFIGDEDVHGRLAAIVANVNRIRESVREVGTGAAAIVGVGRIAPVVEPEFAGKRVLVADDEPNIRQTIVHLLTRYGCEVDAAADGAEAVALLAAQQRYDLVLTDIKMPQKNGYEVFAAAKKLNHSPPVILMTGFGYDPNHSIVRASAEGLTAVLYKPFKVERLLGEVRKAVGAGGQS